MRRCKLHVCKVDEDCVGKTDRKIVYIIKWIYRGLVAALAPALRPLG